MILYEANKTQLDFCTRLTVTCQRVRLLPGHTFSFGQYLVPFSLHHHLAISASLLFHFVLKIFYGTIVVENTEYIPTTGEPW